MIERLTISDRELWACARKVLEMHGTGAEIHAAMRADELLEAGDLAGERVWKAILTRIVEMSTAGPPSIAN